MQTRALNRWWLLILPILAAVTWFALSRPSKKPPFELSFWFWHAPFALTPKETKTLQDLRVKQLFVRAGTFSSDGTNVVLVLPQSYGEGCSAFNVHLVFNADGGVIRHFEEYDLKTMAEQISTRIQRQVSEAEQKKVKVIGVQLDFDCPTRLLPRYADLIRRIKPNLDKRFQFSVTGLMSWLGSSGLKTLSKEIDFIVPQAYEGITGKTVSTMRPVSDLDELRNQIRKAEDLACPYYVGLPAYGHAFLFDQKERLVGTYRNLPPQGALRHPSFAFESAFPADRLGEEAKSMKAFTGEEILRLKAVRPAPDGRGVGYTLAYTIPTPWLVSSSLSAAREVQGNRCLGAILYRFPEEGDSLTIPLDTLTKSIQGHPTKPNLNVAIEAELNSFGVIERNAKDTPKDLYLMVQNTGDAATFVSPDAVQVNVELDVPGVQDVRLRDFDRVTYGPDKARPENASTIELSKANLAPGEKAYVGPIRLLTSNPKHITIAWTVRCDNGLETVSGEVKNLALAPQERK